MRFHITLIYKNIITIRIKIILFDLQIDNLVINCSMDEEILTKFFKVIARILADAASPLVQFGRSLIRGF